VLSSNPDAGAVSLDAARASGEILRTTVAEPVDAGYHERKENLTVETVLQEHKAIARVDMGAAEPQSASGASNRPGRERTAH
jgi:hypothetical protein